MKSFPSNNSRIVEFMTDKGEKSIDLFTLVYMKGQKKFTLFYTKSLECIVVHKSLNKLEKILPSPDFCRCHKSYIINCLYADCTCHDMILLKMKNCMVPLSRGKKQFYKDNLKRYLELNS
jgi:two-component system, LytTR family, response regulator